MIRLVRQYFLLVVIGFFVVEGLAGCAVLDDFAVLRQQQTRPVVGGVSQDGIADKAVSPPETRAASRQSGVIAEEGGQKTGVEKEEPALPAAENAEKTLGPGAGTSFRKANAATQSRVVQRPRVVVAAERKSHRAKRLGKATGSEKILINMEDAELYDVLLFLVDALEMNCIFESNVSGKVTIQTSTPLAQKDLLPLFYQILEAHGLTAVEEGKYFRIIKASAAPKATLPFVGEGQMPGKDGVVVQIIPLSYISSEEMIKLLNPFLSENGSIISHDQSRTLLLIDHRRNVEKALRLVKSFDVDLFAVTKHRFFRLQYADCKSVAEIVKKVLGAYGVDNSKEKIIPLEKMNSLLVLADNEAVFDKVAELLVEFDQPSQDVEPHIYIYFLKNSQAKDMVGLLNSIFAGKNDDKESASTEKSDAKKGSSDSKKSEMGNPFAAKESRPPIKKVRRTGSGDFGSGALLGTLKISADEIRNALVFEAIPSDYRIVERVLQRLDILPRQVLISAKIIDVQLTDTLKFGTEWSYAESDAQPRSFVDFVTAATGSSGVALSFGEAAKWKAEISALASQQQVDIVATPTVLASDNVAAKIDISTEVPVASAQIRYDNDDTGAKTQTNIQYRNTGIILNVTPHINEYGLVSMEVSQEVSEQSNAVEVGGTAYPSFFKRSVQTSLTVNSGQTIALGGLIRETSGKGKDGIPGLSKLPLVGWLFGSQKDESVKSELIILLTPKVIATPDAIDAITEEFTRKSGFEFNADLRP